MSLADLALLVAAGFAAGVVGYVTRLASIISYPALLLVGLNPLTANVTNTVALVPGYLGATVAQFKDLTGQGRRLKLLIPAGVIGGLVGGMILLNTSEKLFSELVPYLILLASGLLAAQDVVRKWVKQRVEAAGGSTGSDAWAIGPVFLAAIYGGYFGAGLSVIILAVLGLVIEDNLTRLNALKQALAFSVNVAAATFFLFSGQVVWAAAAVMAVGALLGGNLGGRFAGRIKPQVLRAVVVTIGVIVALIYLFR